MAGIRAYLNRRLTGQEAMLIVVVIATLAGLGYLGYNAVSAKILEAKVEAALPTVCAGIREQRAKIVGAIESYRKEFGFYPPDHVVSRQPLVVSAYTNPLLYELAGTVIDGRGMVESPGLEAAPIDYLKQFLNTTGFVNSGSSTGAVKHFLSAEKLPVSQLHDDPDVYAVGFQIFSVNVPEETVWKFEIGPWQYVSSAPIHNPGKYDLWIEVKTKKHTVAIGNWKDVE